MGVTRTQVVATAAVREASNGEDFIAAVRAIGLHPHILTGEEEARMAGLGVISAIPDANGIAGDLGGGSLELVDLRDGQIARRISLPFGILRLDPLLESGDRMFERSIRKAVEEAGMSGAARGRAFYMVGGSWRALGRYDMHLSGHPLPITHQHRMHVDRPGALKSALAEIDRDKPRRIPTISTGRLVSLPRANQLLECGDQGIAAFIAGLQAGIREGLLYDQLGPDIRRLDPLIEAAREAGTGLGRFAQHGGLLDSWIAPIFDDPPAMARLRLAACLLADIAWAAHPDFRAERGIDLALHGNWVAIDDSGRVLLAQALFSIFGGGRELPYADIRALCAPADLGLASAWGQAIRLGQRLSGGVAIGLEHSSLSRADGILKLRLGRQMTALHGEAVERRLKALANELGLKPMIERA